LGLFSRGKGLPNTEKEEKKTTWRLILREEYCKVYGRETERKSVTKFAVILGDKRGNKHMRKCRFRDHQREGGG